jgi:uncharacterized membrane protein
MVDPWWSCYTPSYRVAFVVYAQMTAPSVVAWGALLGWLHLAGSPLAFFANKISLVIGYTYRHRLSSMVPDMLLALIEDLVAVGGGFLLVSHL